MVYASPTIQNDVNRYSANHGLPKLTSKNFRQIVPAGLFDVPADDPCGPQGWYGEETLDFEGGPLDGTGRLHPLQRPRVHGSGQTARSTISSITIALTS